MLGLGERGVAAVAVVIIIVAGAGAGVATPVVVDVADVAPDHPLYGLERLGERIRMIGDEDQMKERWGEYARLVDGAKGLEYRHILDEFVELMRGVVPGDVPAKLEIVRWMQEQMPGVGLVQLRLYKELLQELKEDLADLPGVRELIENYIRECEDCEQDWATPELRENVRARLRLIGEKIREIVGDHRARIRRPVDVYFGIDNVLVEVDITVSVEVEITIVKPIPIIAAEFEEELEEFNESLAEVQAMLEGAPENTLGRRAAEQLVEVAIELRDKAVDAHEAGRIRKALALIHAAEEHLQKAEAILDHAVEWEAEFRDAWADWKEGWAEIKREWIEEGIWQDILEGYQQHVEKIRRAWEIEIDPRGRPAVR